ncbi:MAG: hemin uptake protein HemP [Nitrosomonadaceae bacterium]|nr:hemin uptake protein HemP [Nitrosomonadaceae bacterium]MDW7653191.1 hemin uptake protein HemP [Nitrosomonadaceae bacterium]MDW7664216.1 hemin uptake protein HemP [Nitrosomonadaceae bacterium]
MDRILNSMTNGLDITQEFDTEKLDFMALDSCQLIHSDTLFLNKNKVFIQHNGAQYCLQRTRNGKLILTK